MSPGVEDVAGAGADGGDDGHPAEHQEAQTEEAGQQDADLLQDLVRQVDGGLDSEAGPGGRPGRTAPCDRSSTNCISRNRLARHHGDPDQLARQRGGERQVGGWRG